MSYVLAYLLGIAQGQSEELARVPLGVDPLSAGILCWLEDISSEEMCRWTVGESDCTSNRSVP